MSAEDLLRDWHKLCHREANRKAHLYSVDSDDLAQTAKMALIVHADSIDSQVRSGKNPYFVVLNVVQNSIRTYLRSSEGKKVENTGRTQPTMVSLSEHPSILDMHHSNPCLVVEDIELESQVSALRIAIDTVLSADQAKLVFGEGVGGTNAARSKRRAIDLLKKFFLVGRKSEDILRH